MYLLLSLSYIISLMHGNELFKFTLIIFLPQRSLFESVTGLRYRYTACRVLNLHVNWRKAGSYCRVIFETYWNMALWNRIFLGRVQSYWMLFQLHRFFADSNLNAYFNINFLNTLYLHLHVSLTLYLNLPRVVVNIKTTPSSIINQMSFRCSDMNTVCVIFHKTFSCFQICTFISWIPKDNTNKGTWCKCNINKQLHLSQKTEIFFIVYTGLFWERELPTFTQDLRASLISTR